MRLKIMVSVSRNDDSVVIVNGHTLSLEESLLIANHSPTGFSWGYGGSGPHQTAIAIMLFLAKARGLTGKAAARFAVNNSHQFVTDHVSKWDWPHDGIYEVEYNGDACQECHGLNGGVPGNENTVNGRILCDYCHAKEAENGKTE